MSARSSLDAIFLVLDGSERIEDVNKWMKVIYDERQRTSHTRFTVMSVGRSQLRLDDTPGVTVVHRKCRDVDALFRAIFRQLFNRSSASHIQDITNACVHIDEKNPIVWHNLRFLSDESGIIAVPVKYCQLLPGHTGALTCLAVSEDGNYAVTGSMDTTVRIWSLHTGRCMHVLTGHSSTVHRVKFSRDGTRVISASNDKSVLMWDAVTGKRVKQMLGHENVVVDLDVVSNKIVSASWDKTLREWDGVTGECMRVLVGHTNALSCVTYSVDGSKIASGADDRTARVWGDGADATAVLTGHTAPISCISFTNDGTKLITGSHDSTCRLWNADSGICLMRFHGHNGVVHCLSLSIDEHECVSGASDGSLYVWRLDNGRVSFQLKGHTGPVRSVSYSPGSTRIVSGSNDTTLRLWDGDNGQQICTLKGHSNLISSVSYVDDGSCIVSTSYDNKVGVWNLSSFSAKSVVLLNEHACIYRDSSEKYHVYDTRVSRQVDVFQCVVLVQIGDAVISLCDGECTVRLMNGVPACIGVLTKRWLLEHTYDDDDDALSAMGVVINTEYSRSDSNIKKSSAAYDIACEMFDEFLVVMDNVAVRDRCKEITKLQLKLRQVPSLTDLNNVVSALRDIDIDDVSQYVDILERSRTAIVNAVRASSSRASIESLVKERNATHRDVLTLIDSRLIELQRQSETIEKYIEIIEMKYDALVRLGVDVTEYQPWPPLTMMSVGGLFGCVLNDKITNINLKIETMNKNILEIKHHVSRIDDYATQRDDISHAIDKIKVMQPQTSRYMSAFDESESLYNKAADLLDERIPVIKKKILVLEKKSEVAQIEEDIKSFESIQKLCKEHNDELMDLEHSLHEIVTRCRQLENMCPELSLVSGHNWNTKTAPLNAWLSSNKISHLLRLNAYSNALSINSFSCIIPSDRTSVVEGTYPNTRGPGRVVVKIKTYILRRLFKDDMHNIKSFVREIMGLSRVSSPYVIKLMHFFFTSDTDAINIAGHLVLPAYDCSLAEFLTKTTMTVPQSVHIVRSMLEGLRELHSVGVVHGDIKPENVVVSNDLRDVCLIDLSAAADVQRHMPTVTCLSTTMGFMAPEMMVNQQATMATDVYQVGLVLICCLSSTRYSPQFSARFMAMLHQDDTTPLKLIRLDDVPSALQDLVVNMTKKTPDERPNVRSIISLLSTVLLSNNSIDMPANVSNISKSVGTLLDQALAAVTSLDYRNELIMNICDEDGIYDICTRMYDIVRLNNVDLCGKRLVFVNGSDRCVLNANLFDSWMSKVSNGVVSPRGIAVLSADVCPQCPIVPLPANDEPFYTGLGMLMFLCMLYDVRLPYASLPSALLSSLAGYDLTPDDHIQLYPDVDYKLRQFASSAHGMSVGELAGIEDDTVIKETDPNKVIKLIRSKRISAISTSITFIKNGLVNYSSLNRHLDALGGRGLAALLLHPPSLCASDVHSCFLIEDTRLNVWMLQMLTTFEQNDYNRLVAVVRFCVVDTGCLPAPRTVHVTRTSVEYVTSHLCSHELHLPLNIDTYDKCVNAINRSLNENPGLFVQSGVSAGYEPVVRHVLASKPKFTDDDIRRFQVNQLLKECELITTGAGGQTAPLLRLCLSCHALATYDTRARGCKISTCTNCGTSFCHRCLMRASGAHDSHFAKQCELAPPQSL